MQQISALELAALIKQSGENSLCLLDVREPWEFDIAHLPNSTNVPMQRIAAGIGELDPAQPVICICHHGMRSMQVAMYLMNQGFEQVLNLAGGIDAWARQVDTRCATY